MTKLKQLLSACSLKNSPPFFQSSKRLSTLALLAMTATGCHTFKNGSNQPAATPFTLIEASSQQWTAGREEGGRGTDYYFKIVLHTSHITFDSMWVDNKVLPVFIAKETTTVSSKPITYTQGDTIILRGTASAASPTSSQPAGVTGAAVVRYRLDSKPAYYPIAHIEKKPSLKLPTNN